MKTKNEDEQNYFRIIKKGNYPCSCKQPRLDTADMEVAGGYVMGGKEE